MPLLLQSSCVVAFSQSRRSHPSVRRLRTGYGIDEGSGRGEGAAAAASCAMAAAEAVSAVTDPRPAAPAAAPTPLKNSRRETPFDDDICVFPFNRDPSAVGVCYPRILFDSR